MNILPSKFNLLLSSASLLIDSKRMVALLASTNKQAREAKYGYGVVLLLLLAEVRPAIIVIRLFNNNNNNNTHHSK